jgi:hypothetical protein
MTQSIALQIAFLADDQGKPALPNNLTIDGDLDLRRLNLSELPKGLRVRGNLDLRGTSIRTLPPCIIVEGDVLLSGSAVSALPARFAVYRYSVRSYRHPAPRRRWWQLVLG